MNTPNALYRAVQAGGNVKEFLLAMHKRNTGKLTNDTEGIDMRQVKFEKLEKQEPDIADLPTRYMPSIPKSPPMDTSKLVAQILGAPGEIYVDKKGRKCLKITGVMDHTIDLIDKAVKLFKEQTGTYPVEIVPCPSRYWKAANHRSSYFPVGSAPIPYTCDFGDIIDYDVLVRGAS